MKEEDTLQAYLKRLINKTVEPTIHERLTLTATTGFTSETTDHVPGDEHPSVDESSTDN